MSIEHIYGQKLRQLEAEYKLLKEKLQESEAENLRLRSLINEAWNILNNPAPGDSFYLIMHKIRTLLQ